MSTDLSTMEPAKRIALAKFLKELCGYATHQFSDKQGEWGIEEFCFEKLEMLDPENNELEDDAEYDEKVEKADEDLYDMRKAIIDEFEAVFEAGLKAREWKP